jgi:hypothetical protein
LTALILWSPWQQHWRLLLLLLLLLLLAALTV